MKRLRTWLLPILTALVVLTVTVLPQHLSQRQDQKLMGCAHTEEMSAENNLPIQPPDLVQRMELLSRWMEDPAVMSVEHEPSDNTAYDELYAAVLEELQSFVDVGVLPSELMPLEVPVLSASQMYLQQQLAGTEYDVLTPTSKQRIFISGWCWMERPDWCYGWNWDIPLWKNTINRCHPRRLEFSFWTVLASKMT